MKEFELNKKIGEIDSIPPQVKWNPHNGWNSYQEKRTHRKRLKWVYRSTAIAALLVIALFFTLPQLNNKPKKWVSCSGEKLRITLANGIEVVLNQKSDLIYYEKQNMIELTGEAYFTINLKHELKIRINSIEIITRQATFNLKGKPTNQVVILNIESGEATATQNTFSLIVSQNQQATLIPNLAFTVEVALDANYKAWMTNSFVFDNVPLYLVTEQLNETFNTTFEFTNRQTRYCSINAEIKGNSIDEVVDRLPVDDSFKIIKNNEKYIVTGNGC